MNRCERVDELIGFLYGELSETEASSFERHLCECAACAGEFAAFGQIHESMVEWRNESLGFARAPLGSSDPVLATAPIQPRIPAKSALAALREFFALSPLWMKGATAFATVLFCACAVLAVAYMKARPFRANVANANGGRVFTPEEVNEQVTAAVEKTRREMREKDKQPPDRLAADSPSKKSVNRSNGSTVAGSPRRPFTRQERQELATDLRLVSSKDDDDLDLTIDSNRPAP